MLHRRSDPFNCALFPTLVTKYHLGMHLIMMKILAMCAAVTCAAGCSSVASSVSAASGPEVGAAPAVTQFTEITWPTMLTTEPGWTQANFVFGLPPRITSTGGQGATVDVRSREGDTLVALAFSAQGNGSASVQAKAYAFTASGGELLSDVLDQRRPAGFALVMMPLRAAHVMLPGEGLVIQLDAGSQSYQVSAIQATWTRPAAVP